MTLDKDDLMLRRLYHKILNLSGHRLAGLWLAIVSFAESSVFPVPPDVMLAPMILAKPEKAYTYAAICTAASVAGGALGYAIGYYLEPIGHALLALTGHTGGVAQFQAWYAEWGVWVILIKGFTPIPYKLVTVASGLAQFSFPIFIAASVATRGGRFFLEAYLIKRFGVQVQAMIEKRMILVTTVALVVVIGGFLAVKLLR
jgi:membrane protein YqaA with SNARE-associated domain